MMIGNDAEALQVAMEAEMMEELEAHQMNHSSFKKSWEAMVAEVRSIFILAYSFRPNIRRGEQK